MITFQEGQSKSINASLTAMGDGGNGDGGGGTCQFQGLILDGETGEPIEYALVYVDGVLKYTSASNGGYQMIISQGSHTVEIVANDYETLTTTVNLTSTFREKNYTLTPATVLSSWSPIQVWDVIVMPPKIEMDTLCEILVYCFHQTGASITAHIYIMDGDTVIEDITRDITVEGNPTYRFSYRPTRAGIFTINAGGQTTTLEVTPTEVGTFYDPFGSVRVSNCLSPRQASGYRWSGGNPTCTSWEEHCTVKQLTAWGYYGLEAVEICTPVGSNCPPYWDTRGRLLSVIVNDYAGLCSPWSPIVIMSWASEYDGRTFLPWPPYHYAPLVAVGMDNMTSRSFLDPGCTDGGSDEGPPPPRPTGQGMTWCPICGLQIIGGENTFHIDVLRDLFDHIKSRHPSYPFDVPKGGIVITGQPPLSPNPQTGQLECEIRLARIRKPGQYRVVCGYDLRVSRQGRYSWAAMKILDANTQVPSWMEAPLVLDVELANWGDRIYIPINLTYDIVNGVHQHKIVIYPEGVAYVPWEEIVSL